MSGAQEVSRFRSEMAIPERKLTFFANQLASLEKLTSMLGKLNGIWATTVVLGGFPTALEGNDFWYVSVILAAEGIRIFGRRGELQTGYSPLDNVIRFCSFVIQYCSAGVFFFFSSRALSTPADYGPSGSSARNRNLALRLFYFLSTVESAMILAGLFLRVFSGIAPKMWSSEGKRGGFPAILTSRWVLEVRRKYNLDDSQINTLYRFFHHTYCRCVSGGFSDSRKITLVSYSVELLQSSHGDEQLKGVTLLSGLVKNNPRALERLRSIGTIQNVVEMLIDMLNWDSKESPDKGIRVAAAKSIRSLVKNGRHRTLVMAAPNSMESIASLLDDGNQVEINSSQNRTQSSPEYRNLSKVGLRILKQLANDHDNRAKMGSNGGLLLKIITLTESNAPELKLKILAISTLTIIARDQKFRESIGGTDGVLHNFYSLFFEDINIHNEHDRELAVKELAVRELAVSMAGEALGFLSLENHHNCEILMNFPYLIQDLISVLNDRVQGTYAARILRNLYAHLEANSVELEANSVNLNKIRAASAEVVQLAKEKEGVHQEAAIGLAAQIFKFPKFPSPADYELVFGEQGGNPSLISKLRDVLQQNASPSKELPNIRRFSILLLIAIMKMDIRLTIGNELRRNLMNALKEVKKTTSVLESCSTFSGTIGLTSHRMSIPFLAHSAMDLLHPDPTRRHRENDQVEVDQVEVVTH